MTPTPVHPHSPEAAAAELVVADHPQDDLVPAEHDHFADCLAGHVMAACVAIITAIGGIGLARKLLSQRRLVARVGAAALRVRGLVERPRPPDPAWVRLSVMRC